MKYVIFMYDEVDKINFDEIKNTSKLTLRMSKIGKSIIKYDGDTPESLKSLKWISPEYSIDEINKILSTEDEWLIDHPSKIVTN